MSRKALRKDNSRTKHKDCGCILWQRRDAMGKWYTKRAYIPVSCLRHSSFVGGKV